MTTKKKPSKYNQGSGLLALPYDVLSRDVAQFLTLAEACRAQQVCRQLRVILSASIESSFQVFEASGLDMNDMHARALVRRMKALRALRLHNVSSLVAQDVAVRAGPRLRVFECSTQTINDTMVAGIVRACLGLEVLRLAPSGPSKVLAVSDICLVYIARRAACASFLKEVSIRSAPGITENGLTYLMAFCPRLAVLEAIGCGVCGEFGIIPASLLLQQQPEQQQQQREITEVDVQEGQVNNTEGGVPKLFAPCLQRVNLSSNYELTRSSILSIPSLDRLKSLSLMGAACLQDVTLDAIAMSCPEMEELCIANCSMVTDQGLESLADGLAGMRLKRLDVARCSRIADSGLIAMARLGQLEYLDAQGCFRVSDYCLKMIGMHCHALRYANFKGMQSLSDYGVEALAKGCPLLQTLVLASCNVLSDVSLLALGTNCPQLEHLDLFCVHQITDDGLLFLAGGCPKIKSLDLSYCFRVSSEFLSRCRTRKYYWKGLVGLQVMGLQEEADVSMASASALNRSAGRFTSSFFGGNDVTSVASAAQHSTTATTRSKTVSSPTTLVAGEDGDDVLGSPGGGGKKRNRPRRTSSFRQDPMSPNSGGSKKTPVMGLELTVAGSPRAKIMALAKEGMAALSLGEDGHLASSSMPVLDLNAVKTTGSSRVQQQHRRFGDTKGDFEREKAFAVLDESVRTKSSGEGQRAMRKKN